MKETDIAYIAGLIDGEGYIGIKKIKPTAPSQRRRTVGYVAKIQIGMTSEEAIVFIAKSFGGKRYTPAKMRDGGRKQLFRYEAVGIQADDILRKTLPYLKVKKQSALTVLEYRKLQSRWNEHRTKQIGYRMMPNGRTQVPYCCLSDEYIEKCEELYLRCKYLNKKGVRASGTENVLPVGELSSPIASSVGFG